MEEPIKIEVPKEEPKTKAKAKAKAKPKAKPNVPPKSQGRRASDKLRQRNL